MNDPRPTLRPFVEALRIDESNRLRLADDLVRPAPGNRDAAAQLAADLLLCTYEHAYARRFPATPACVEECTDLISMLAAANATQARTEDGWRALEVRPDGSVIGERHGRQMRFAAGRYVVSDGVAPPRPGSPLLINFPAGSSVLQPGFHHCFSTAPRDPDDPVPLVRLYFNVQLKRAPALVREITTALNRYEIPFEFKITTRTADFGRRDNAVLYISQDLYRITALALASVLPSIIDTLSDDVPLFAKRLAPGIGLAEDPCAAGESFGSSRCRLVASALVAARQNGRFGFAPFADALERTVAAEGLDLQKMWLNPGARDHYPFPSIRSVRG